MNDESKPAKDAPKIHPAISELLKARATGEYPDGELPLPTDMRRDREEWAEHFRNRNPTEPAEEPTNDASASEHGPNRRIGPQNPDHPDVNRKPGGRDPA